MSDKKQNKFSREQFPTVNLDYGGGGARKKTWDELASENTRLREAASMSVNIDRREDLVKCQLCRGSGENRTGIRMRVNTDICPRCGGYGLVSGGTGNRKSLTAQDQEYIDCNGQVAP